MNDRISARCSGCSATLGLPLYTAGKRIRCPKCQAVVDVPLDAELLGAGPDPQRKKNPESPPKASPRREQPPQREQSPRVTESRRGSSASRAAPSAAQKPRASRDDDASAAGKRRSSGSSSVQRPDRRGAQPARTGGRRSPERSEPSRSRQEADYADDTYANELDFIADYGHDSGYDNPYAALSLPPSRKAGRKAPSGAAADYGGLQRLPYFCFAFLLGIVLGGVRVVGTEVGSVPIVLATITIGWFGTIALAYQRCKNLGMNPW